MSLALDDASQLAQRRALERLRSTTRTPAGEPADEHACAGLVTRAVAFALDALVIDGVAVVAGLGVALVLSVLHLPSQLNILISAIGGVVWIVWSVAYFVFFWSSTGQTPGNRLMRIRVIDAGRGGAPRLRKALLRFAGLVLAVIPLFAGVWMMLWDERRRCLQDRLARTLVLYDPEEQPTWLLPAEQAAAEAERET